MVKTSWFYVVAFLLGFGAAWYLQEGYKDAEVDKVTLRHERALKSLQDASLEQYNQEVRKRKEIESTRKIVDEQYYKELTDVRTENTRLAGELSDHKRLSVRVSRPVPACPSGDTGPTDAPSVDDAEIRADIHPRDAADIIALTGRADACAVTLTGLQEWVLAPKSQQ